MHRFDNFRDFHYTLLNDGVKRIEKKKPLANREYLLDNPIILLESLKFSMIKYKNTDMAFFVTFLFVYCFGLMLINWHKYITNFFVGSYSYP